MTVEQEKALQRLRMVWAKNPDLRLAQLLGNVFPVGSGNDPYYHSDEKFMEIVEKFYNSVNNPLDKNLTGD